MQSLLGVLVVAQEQTALLMYSLKKLVCNEEKQKGKENSGEAGERTGECYRSNQE